MHIRLNGIGIVVARSISMDSRLRSPRRDVIYISKVRYIATLGYIDNFDTISNTTYCTSNSQQVIIDIRHHRSS